MRKIIFEFHLSYFPNIWFGNLRKTEKMFQYDKEFRVRNSKTSPREREAVKDVMLQVIKASVGPQSRTALV
jgi:hypothetical protein